MIVPTIRVGALDAPASIGNACRPMAENASRFSTLRTALPFTPGTMSPLPYRPGAKPFMFTLAHLDTPPPESLNAQVLQMVVDYLSDISPVSLTPSNPLYQLYQYVVGYEVHLYLQSMDGAQPGQPKLMLALDDEDPARVLGFTLYLPYVDYPDACALVYLAVQASHRRNGIGSGMV